MLGYSIHKLKPTGTGAFLKCKQVTRMRKRLSTFLVCSTGGDGNVYTSSL